MAGQGTATAATGRQDARSSDPGHVWPGPHHARACRPAVRLPQGRREWTRLPALAPGSLPPAEPPPRWPQQPPGRHSPVQAQCLLWEHGLCQAHLGPEHVLCPPDSLPSLYSVSFHSCFQKIKDSNRQVPSVTCLMRTMGFMARDRASGGHKKGAAQQKPRAVAWAGAGLC